MEPPEASQERDEDLEQYGRFRVPRAEALTPDLESGTLRKGEKPGSRRFRPIRERERRFEEVGAGEYRVTEEGQKPVSGTEALLRAIKSVVVGTPLATSRLVEERLTKIKALPVFASDNLSSSAYATEEILLVLLLAGTAAFTWSVPVALAIVALIIIVSLSYTQVIRGYPNGGGSYAVARENLGTIPSLVAGSSLVVDYTLTVAVSTAAGVAAIVSAIPELHDARVPLALASVGVLTLGNLRGIRESGTLFAVPAYFFVASVSIMLVTGVVRLALGHDVTAGVPSETIEEGTQAVTLFLVLRAFSSGAAALTGIEAISNGVPTFKPPEARNANITLGIMATILAIFFIGITFLGYQLDAVPSEKVTVIAQVADGVFNGGPMFYVVQLATMLILLLAANTSFAGLPSLGSVMAKDRFLPHQFAYRGDRLAFSYGIVFLGAASMGLLVIFGADTHRLIPLYAVGVFIGFTLSQAGMVRHWLGDSSRSARLSLAINVVGVIATGLVTVIIAATKFVDGAWLTLAAIALLTFFFSRIHGHYAHVEKLLKVGAAPLGPPAPQRSMAPGTDGYRGRPVILPVDQVNQATLRALDYARTISDRVTAVHITDELEAGERLRAEWEAVVPDTPFVPVESPYRSFITPMVNYIDEIDRVDPGAYITVVLPEYIPAHFWEGILHNQSSVHLKNALRARPNTIIISVPYHLEP
jgi:amino acid transporter